MVIKREIEDIEDRLHPITDHRCVTKKPKRNEALDILGQMRGQGDTDRVPGDLFVPEAMPRGEAQFTPGELTQAIERVSKGSFFPLLACSKTVSPAVEIAEGE